MSQEENSRLETFKVQSSEKKNQPNAKLRDFCISCALNLSQQLFDRRLLKKNKTSTSGHPAVFASKIKKELDYQLLELKDFGSELVVELSKNEAWFRGWKIVNSKDEDLMKSIFRQALCLGLVANVNNSGIVKIRKMGFRSFRKETDQKDVEKYQEFVQI